MKGKAPKADGSNNTGIDHEPCTVDSADRFAKATAQRKRVVGRFISDKEINAGNAPMFTS